MKETLNIWLRIIQVDFYIPFGVFTILFVIVSFFVRKDHFVFKIDEQACRFISFMGVVFCAIFMMGIFLLFMNGTEEEKQSMIDRMFGHYWLGFWLPPLLYIFLPQLLRLEKIRNSKIIRLILSIFFIISIERYVILMTSLHRDYLPSSWNLSISLWDSIFGIILKLTLFLAFVRIYYLADNQLKKLKTKYIQLNTKNNV